MFGRLEAEYPGWRGRVPFPALATCQVRWRLTPDEEQMEPVAPGPPADGHVTLMVHDEAGGGPTDAQRAAFRFLMENRDQFAANVLSGLVRGTKHFSSYRGGPFEPHVERRTIDEADIHARDIELGLFGGLISVEDFGSSSLLGGSLGYHLTEDFFVEGAYGTAKAGKTSFERLAGDVQLLTDSERKFRFYDLSLGYHLLPGESFIGSLDGSGPEERLGGTIAACVLSAQRGAHVVRVHDVHETRQAFGVLQRGTLASITQPGVQPCSARGSGAEG